MAAVLDSTPRTFLSPQIVATLQTHYAAQAQDVLGFHSVSLASQGSEKFLETLQQVPPINRVKECFFPLAGKPTPSESPLEVWGGSRPRLHKYRDRVRIYEACPSADICFENMNRIDHFSRKIFKRHPVENETKLMKAIIHHKLLMNNACWVPSLECVIFGDVDPTIFNPLDVNEDVISHEFGHAVIQYSGGLQYKDQSGALNESLADIFAIMAKHYRLNVKANDPDASWLIGEKLVVNDRAKGALRSMDAPGSAYNSPVLGQDPQPEDMRGYKKISEDYGGVHIYSGIPNRAFCLAAKADQNFAWERIGKIWLQALEESLATVNFSQFALKTIKIAQKNYGDPVADIVGRAWLDVKVKLYDDESFWERSKIVAGGSAVGLLAFGLLEGIIGKEAIMGKQTKLKWAITEWAIASGAALVTQIAMENYYAKCRIKQGKKNLRELGVTSWYY